MVLKTLKDRDTGLLDFWR